MLRAGLLPHAHFRNPRAGRQHLFPDLGRFRRVEDIHPAGHDRHRAAVQSGGMGGRVDAARQAGHDDKARIRQILGDGPRHPQPKGGGIARPDHGNHRAVQGLGLSLDPQQRRRVRHIQQLRRIISGADHDQPRLRRLSGAQFCHGIGFGADLVVAHPRLGGDLRQGRQRGLGRAVLMQQPIKGRDPDPSGAQEAKPRQPVIFRGGWEWGVSGRMIVHDRCNSACLRNQV